MYDTRVKRATKSSATIECDLAEDEAQERAWEVLADRDALWATCTSGKRKVDWDLTSFMQTGIREVSWALSHAKAIGVLPDRIDYTIDFGCGPGRLSGALADITEKVVGVDPSPTMRRLASTHHPQPKFTFVSSLDAVEDSTAQLIYSTFVLQHLSEAGRHKAIAEIARVLRPGGLLVFQLPQKPRKTFGGIVWMVLPLAALMWIQRQILRFPEAMPMRWASQERVRQELQEAQLDLQDSIEGLRYSPNWTDIWYFARKRQQ